GEPAALSMKEEPTVMLRTALLTLVALLATTLPAPAQQKYDIKFKKFIKGLAELVERTEIDDDRANTVDQDGKVIKELARNQKTKSYLFRNYILDIASGAAWASRFRVVYEKAEEHN